MTRAERNIRWIEAHVHLPAGKNVGEPIRLAEFMRADLGAIYDNPNTTRRAIISRGRKNAKTTSCAVLVLLHLCGPEHRINSQLFSAAQSREQAGVLFDLAVKIVRLSPKLQSVIQIREAAKELLCLALGTSYKALSAEASTAYGLNPALTIFDELGQTRGPRDELFEALETAGATQEEPLTIIISTQAPNDQDLLSILIDDALAGHDPSVVLRLDTAPEDADPFDEETIRLANPAYDVFMNKKEVRSQASGAQRMPAREASFRNHVLNQRVNAENSFVSMGAWMACNAPPAELRGREVYGGLDLSSVRDLTALVLAWRDPSSGDVSVRPTFWLPSHGLVEKSAHDRVPYDLWHEGGDLLTTPGAAIQYEFIAQYLWAEVFTKHHVVKIGFDRWNFQQLVPWLRLAGFSEAAIKNTLWSSGKGRKA